MNHPQEVVRVAFPAGHDAPAVVELGKETFDFPAPPFPSEDAAILRGGALTIRPMRRDQCDAVLFAQPRGERVGVIGAIADQARGTQPEWHRVKRLSPPTSPQ